MGLGYHSSVGQEVLVVILILEGSVLTGVIGVIVVYAVIGGEGGSPR